MRRRVTAMTTHFPDALIAGWEPLVPAVRLPAPDDRHVVAADLRGRADCIVTHNTRHFQADVLESLGLGALTPDAFLLDQLDLAPTLTVDVITLRPQRRAELVTARSVLVMCLIR